MILTPAYYQGRKCRRLRPEQSPHGRDLDRAVRRRRGLGAGHGWRDGCKRTQAVRPDGHAWQQINVVEAPVYDHMVTTDDDLTEPNPLKRMRWRPGRRPVDPWLQGPRRLHRLEPAEGVLPLQAGPGDRAGQPLGELAHGVRNSKTGRGPFVIHHYPYRSAEQLTQKISQGLDAYRAAPDLPPGAGMHWKEWARRWVDGRIEPGQDFDEALTAHDPKSGPELIEDRCRELPEVGGQAVMDALLGTVHGDSAKLTGALAIEFAPRMILQHHAPGSCPHSFDLEGSGPVEVEFEQMKERTQRSKKRDATPPP